jgi:hypothetical protein
MGDPSGSPAIGLGLATHTRTLFKAQTLQESPTLHNLAMVATS